MVNVGRYTIHGMVWDILGVLVIKIQLIQQLNPWDMIRCIYLYIFWGGYLWGYKQPGKSRKSNVCM